MVSKDFSKFSRRKRKDKGKSSNQKQDKEKREKKQGKKPKEKCFFFFVAKRPLEEGIPRILEEIEKQAILNYRVIESCLVVDYIGTW